MSNSKKKKMTALTFGDVTYEVVDAQARSELSDKAKPNGIASLDETGKVPQEQLPEMKSYSGEGENSFATNDTAVAIGDYSFASGKNSIAGCKGYYIKSIDMTNKKIYLCSEKQKLPEISEVDNTDASFATPAYAAGDEFNIINGSHYILCGKITAIANNVITYSGDLGFTELVEDTDPEGHTLSVPRKSTVGDVVITNNSYAVGENAIAAGRSGYAEGRDVLVAGNYGHAEGRRSKAGYAAHAEGADTEALGLYSHAEGGNAKAKGDASHAEGDGNESIGRASHSEGLYNKAIGKYSHAEGYQTEALNTGSHTEGYMTRAEYAAHAEGYETQALGSSSHSEGSFTLANNDAAHAEGINTVASGHGAHSEGLYNKAIGKYSHAEGYDTVASGYGAHSEGHGTIANGYAQHTQGQYNEEDKNNRYLHIVGNGTYDNARSNAHTVDWQGNAWYKGSITSNGADYAEYFEWLDGNLNAEDRVGLLVALDCEKITLANAGDEVLGIISGTAAVLGDNYECEWNGKYLTDDFGRVIYDMVEEFEDEIVGEDEDGNPIIKKQSLGFFKHPRINPDYNQEQAYVNRADRPEWDTVGMLGKLYVRDDGTCQVNGYATVGENGIATASSEKTNMRVLSRVNENVVRVLLK